MSTEFLQRSGAKREEEISCEMMALQRGRKSSGQAGGGGKSGSCSGVWRLVRERKGRKEGFFIEREREKGRMEVRKIETLGL